MIVAFTHREVRIINYKDYLCVSWFITVLPTVLLENTFYVPSFSRNLVSVSRLVKVGFSFLFENSTFSLSKNKAIIGYGSLIDGLYKF